MLSSFHLLFSLFQVSTLLAYHALRLTPRYRLFAYLHVLLHKEGHSSSGLFKWEPANFGIMHFFTGLFYGAVPYSYPMAHNKIHHAYDNDLDDVHTNLDLDRSKVNRKGDSTVSPLFLLLICIKVHILHLLFASFCSLLGWSDSCNQVCAKGPMDVLQEDGCRHGLVLHLVDYKLEGAEEKSKKKKKKKK